MFILFPSLTMILDHHQFTSRLFHIVQFNGNILDIHKLLRQLPSLNLNYLTYHGQSLVHFCCLYNRLDLLKLFVEDGECDILMNNADGWLPLHIAVYLGYMDIVDYLLEFQVQKTCERDEYGKNHF
ncbi:hypothetical protein I4U23_029205 [Adineta vaga]|nr:hypothetical protein I4U23_029205 [Adineta vaga]